MTAALQLPWRHRIGRPTMLARLLTLAWIGLAAVSLPAGLSPPAGAAEGSAALHYLRALCGANEGAKWRNEMQALVDAETQGGDRRDKLIAGFNRGYRGYQQTYRTCTPAANLVIRRYLDEGARISRDITARYAN
jgi:uncharacterized protein (TIGR02301 family)